MPSGEPCAVCPKAGTVQCSRCRSIRFCGVAHQKLLWSSHKFICKPNERLVYIQRDPTPAEYGAFIAEFMRRGTGEVLTEAQLRDIVENSGVEYTESGERARVVHSMLTSPFLPFGGGIGLRSPDAFNYTSLLIHLISSTERFGPVLDLLSLEPNPDRPTAQLTVAEVALRKVYEWRRRLNLQAFSNRTSDKCVVAADEFSNSFALSLPNPLFLRPSHPVSTHVLRPPVRCLPKGRDVAVFALQVDEVLWGRAPEARTSHDLWSSHKVICKAGKPLTFSYRQPTAFEAQAMWDTAVQDSGHLVDRVLADGDGVLILLHLTRPFAERLSAFCKVQLRRNLNALEDSRIRNAILTHILGESFRPFTGIPFPPTTDAFNYIAVLFTMLGLKLPEPDHPRHPFDSIGQSRLNKLAFNVRREFELQALVLFTLIEHNALEELVGVAEERLCKIVEGEDLTDDYPGAIKASIGFNAENLKFRSTFISSLLCSSLRHTCPASPPPTTDAFNYISVLFGLLRVGLPESDQPLNSRKRVERTPLSDLNLDLRRDFELQALVLFTLVEKAAPAELVVVAIGRLNSIVEGLDDVYPQAIMESLQVARERVAVENSSPQR
ncbi:hypothetical protein P7C70_g6697, partial [Phenoliferia sp. Uapishka_3]